MISTCAPASCSRAADSHALCPWPITATRRPRNFTESVCSHEWLTRPARQTLELSGPVLVVEEPGRHDDASGKNVIAVFEYDFKAAVAGCDPNDFSVIEVGRDAFLEPRSVIDEILDRQ